MFIQTWNKYLPVIKILLKRSLNSEQTLDMNKSDFQRAASGKKVKFTFSVVLIKGRLTGIVNPPPLARDLATVLQQDDVSYKFLRLNEMEFSMNSSFQLTIRATKPVEKTETPDHDPAAELKPGDPAHVAG